MRVLVSSERPDAVDISKVPALVSYAGLTSSLHAYMENGGLDVDVLPAIVMANMPCTVER